MDLRKTNGAYAYQIYIYRDGDYVEDVDILDVKLANPPVFYATMGIAVGVGFGVILLVYFLVYFQKKIAGQKGKRVNMEAIDDL